MTKRTRLQELQGMFSDIFKDVNGFRPRHTFQDDWNSVEWLENQVDTLAIELGVVMEEEKRIQAENVSQFESLVDRVISTGAGDRQTAVRWLMDSDDCGNDFGYLEYKFNVPYGYIEKSI